MTNSEWLFNYTRQTTCWTSRQRCLSGGFKIRDSVRKEYCQRPGKDYRQNL